MTEQTAKKVFDILLSEIRSNGLSDIGTFLIDEVNKDNEFENFSADYKYRDTKTELSELETLSSNPQGALFALRRLLDATEEYFAFSSAIPNKFQTQLKKLGSDRKDFLIRTETLTDKEEVYDTILDNKSIIDLLELLRVIKTNLETDDDIFLKITDEF